MFLFQFIVTRVSKMTNQIQVMRVINMFRRQKKTLIITFIIMCSLLSYLYIPLYLYIQVKERNVMKSYEIPWNQYHHLERNLLTLFTTWGNDRNKTTVLHNTISNWRSLGPCVGSIVFTNTIYPLHGVAKTKGWRILPAKTGTDENIPLFKDMFKQAMEAKKTEFYGYSNSDILYTPLLIKTLLEVLSFRVEKKRPVLIVGRRTDLFVVDVKNAENETNVLKYGIDNGAIGRDDAVDYFIISSDFPLDDLANVVVGRIAYDNYIIMHARANRVLVIDATQSNPSIHQTTEAGNFEGHLHRNKLYNIELLEKEKEITNYDGGSISCSNFATNYSVETKEVSVHKKASKPPRCMNMFEAW